MTTAPTSAGVTATPSTGRVATAGELAHDRVHAVIASVCRADLGTSGSRRTLAVLRRGVRRDSGTDPELWPYTTIDAEDVPAYVLTRAEDATRIALSLWAHHSQGSASPAHVRGRAFATSVGAMAFGPNPNGAAQRHFTALVVARTQGAIEHHLYSLVTVLRSGGQGADYAALASDIADLLDPFRGTSVRRRWARQYTRTTWSAPQGPSVDDNTPKE